MAASIVKAEMLEASFEAGVRDEQGPAARSDDHRQRAHPHGRLADGGERSARRIDGVGRDAPGNVVGTRGGDVLVEETRSAHQGRRSRRAERSPPGTESPGIGVSAPVNGLRRYPEASFDPSLAT